MQVRRIITVVSIVTGLALVGLSASMVAFASKPPGHKVKLCHAHPPDASPPNGYNLIEVDVASADTAKKLNGHREHSADIIPDFWYPAQGTPGAQFHAGQGDQSILANGCKVGGSTSTSTSTSTSSSSSTQSTSTSSTQSTSTNTTTRSTTTVPTTSSTTHSSSTQTSTTSTQPVIPTTTTTNTASTTPTPTNVETSTTAPATIRTRASGPGRLHPTKKSLQKALKKQEKLPGTGRTSNATSPGQLPNTGVDELWLAIMSLGLILSGFGFRKLATQITK